MNQKEQLKKQIEEKECQLIKAEQECDAWNKGKYKTHSNASMSKNLVTSLRKEIERLKKELSDLG